jgi:hypothetical protein
MTITPEDHEAGYKDVTVRLRSGKQQVLRLLAPDHRTARGLGVAYAESSKQSTDGAGNAEPILLACLGADVPANILNRIAPQQIPDLEYAAMILTFGEPAKDEKKTGEPPVPNAPVVVEQTTG